MSETQRQLFQKKLREAEAALGFDFSEEAEEGDEEEVEEQNQQSNQQKSQQKPYFLTKSKFKTKSKPKPILSVIPWSQFFDYNEVITHINDKFNVYYSLPESAQSAIFIFHHGAGSSAMTFAPLIKELVNEAAKKGQKRPGFLSYDARGHGKTEAKPVFSRDVLVADFWVVYKFFTKKLEALPGNKTVILVGHSLGGSVLTTAAESIKVEKKSDKGEEESDNKDEKTESTIIKGLVMLDIVEGTAVQSLAHMNRFISSRPPGFKSYQDAVDWHIKSGFLRNRNSANITVPSLLQEVENAPLKYVWASNIAATEPYWGTWFTGLSDGFVNAKVQSKLLILAGNDNLDKDLMIGQMQGKYQLIVFTDTGHFLHEDSPSKTAVSLMDFWERNFATAKIPILWGHFNGQ